MPADFMDSGRLRIGRFHIHCLVHEDHPEPERIRSNMTGIVEDMVPGVLSAVMARSFEAGDESLWFIRKLELAVEVNASGDAHAVAHSIAVRTTVAVADEMRVVDGRNVVRFDNPAQYLAAFLADLADGTAWQRWYYRAFEGLQLLPVSAALRTAICDDIDTGRAALTSIGPQVRRRLVDRLKDADAGRILEAIEAGMDSRVVADDAESLDLAVQAIPSLFNQGLSRNQLALWLWLELRRPSTAAHSAIGLCAALSSLVRSIERLEVTRFAELLTGLEGRELPILFRTAEPNDATAIATLVHLSDVQLSRIVEAFRPAGKTGRATHDVDSGIQTTGFGGAFYLLPLLDRRDWNRYDTETAAMIRWLILMKCFGPARAAAAVNDDVLREVTGVPAHFDAPPQLDERRDRVLAIETRRLLRDFAGRLPGFAASGPNYLFENFLNCRATIERRPGRIVVTLGRAPLDLILNVTGMNRQRYELSWLRGERFELYPEFD
jgi:hypothetical protein